MSSEQVFPYLPDVANSIPQVLSYDLTVEKAFPGVVLEPTEPNGEYQEIREVYGALWLVTNALWNANTLQWEQDSPCNPALPAFALALLSNGELVRYESPATNVPGLPITWVPLFEIDANGLITKTPQNLTTSSAVAETTDLTWDPGTAVTMVANEINLTDVASSSASLFDNFVTNGTPVWQVDKEGVLITGEVPFSNIIDFSPTFSGATFSGTTTFYGPAVFNDGITVSGGINTDTLSASGTVHAGGFQLGDGGYAPDTPTSTTTYFTTAAVGSTCVIPVLPCTYFPVGTVVLLSGVSNAAGGMTSFTGFVTAVNGNPATMLTVQVAEYITGEAGDIVSPDAHVSYGVANLYESTDGSVNIANGGTAAVPIVNITTAYKFPAYIEQTFTTPAVGTSQTLTIQASLAFVLGQYIIIACSSPAFALVGKVTSSASPTSVTYTAVEYLIGTAGESVASNQALITFGSYIPDPIPVGGVVPSYLLPTPAQANAGITNTLPTLPYAANGGTCTYALFAHAGCDNSSGAVQVLTGVVGTWTGSPTEAPDENTDAIQYVEMIGTAVSGQAPSVSWYVNGSGVDPGTNFIAPFTLTAIRTA